MGVAWPSPGQSASTGLRLCGAVAQTGSTEGSAMVCGKQTGCGHNVCNNIGIYIHCL